MSRVTRAVAASTNAHSRRWASAIAAPTSGRTAQRRRRGAGDSPARVPVWAPRTPPAYMPEVSMIGRTSTPPYGAGQSLAMASA